MGVATLHGIRNCDTGRWCREVGWDALLNRAVTTFRKLPESEKAPSSVVGFRPDLYQSLKW
jgi:hypothetical protein